MEETFFKDIEERMKRSIEAMQKDFGNVRTGRATPGMVEKLHVEAYGSEMPLNSMANISVPDARTLVIQPYDKGQIANIERAIHKSDLGITPMNDGVVIRLVFPPLTQERRKDLVKHIKKRAEEAKVAVRNLRRDALEDLKKVKDLREDDKKKGEERLQKVTDKWIHEVDHNTHVKEKEIMEV